jgi:hypothetical protein
MVLRAFLDILDGVHVGQWLAMITQFERNIFSPFVPFVRTAIDRNAWFSMLLFEMIRKQIEMQFCVVRSRRIETIQIDTFCTDPIEAGAYRFNQRVRLRTSVDNANTVIIDSVHFAERLNVITITTHARTGAICLEYLVYIVARRGMNLPDRL